MNEREIRTFAFDNLKVERRASEAGPLIRGHAAVFNQLSEDFGGWREQIAPGAFKGVLGDDVRALLNHNVDWLLGRTVSKTLRIAEDETGLAVEIEPPDTQLARDLVIAPLERGDLSQMSFAFSGASSAWEEGEAGQYVRTILTMERLWDVSLVTYPAYPQTDAGAREFRMQHARRAIVPVGALRARRQRAHESLTRPSDRRKRG